MRRQLEENVYPLPEPPLQRFFLKNCHFVNDNTGEPESAWVDDESAVHAAHRAALLFGQLWEPDPVTGRREFEWIEWISTETGERMRFSPSMDRALEDLVAVVKARSKSQKKRGGRVSAFPLDAAEEGSGSPERRMVSLRLTAEARDVLRKQSKRLGISQAALIEIFLRQPPNSYGSLPSER